MISMMIHANVSLFCSFTPKMGEGFSMFFVSWPRLQHSTPSWHSSRVKHRFAVRMYMYIYIYVICQGDVNHLALVMSYRGGAFIIANSVTSRNVASSAELFDPFLIAEDEDRLRWCNRNIVVISCDLRDWTKRFPTVCWPQGLGYS